MRISGKTLQFTCAGVRHDVDLQGLFAAIHDAAMMQDEAAAPAADRSLDAFDGDIHGRSFFVRHRGEHFSPARRVEIAMEGLFDPHAALRFAAVVMKIERRKRDLEGARGD